MNFNADAMSTERNYGIVDRDPEDVTDVQRDLRSGLGDGERHAADAREPDVHAPRSCRRRTRSRACSTHINSAQTHARRRGSCTSRTTACAPRSAPRRQRGVTVRVILEDPTDTSIRAYLKGLGIPVQIADAFYLHSEADHRGRRRVRRLGEHVVHVADEEPRGRRARVRAGGVRADPGAVRDRLDERDDAGAVARATSTSA